MSIHRTLGPGTSGSGCTGVTALTTHRCLHDAAPTRGLWLCTRLTLSPTLPPAASWRGDTPRHAGRPNAIRLRCTNVAITSSVVHVCSERRKHRNHVGSTPWHLSSKPRAFPHCTPSSLTSVTQRRRRCVVARDAVGTFAPPGSDACRRHRDNAHASRDRFRIVRVPLSRDIHRVGPQLSGLRNAVRSWADSQQLVHQADAPRASGKDCHRQAPLPGTWNMGKNAGQWPAGAAVAMG